MKIRHAHKKRRGPQNTRYVLTSLNRVSIYINRAYDIRSSSPITGRVSEMIEHYALECIRCVSFQMDN